MATCVAEFPRAVGGGTCLSLKYALRMYLLTQAIRRRLRKHPPFLQHANRCPKVLIRLSTKGHLYGCGPWTWWVLGASESEDDDWLFAGVMESHAGAEAGLFSMEEIRRLNNLVWPHITRIDGDQYLPQTLIPVWLGLDSRRPVRLMEFTFGEITIGAEETLMECYERELDWFDLQFEDFTI